MLVKIKGEKENMKKITTLFLTIFLLFGFLPTINAIDTFGVSISGDSEFTEQITLDLIVDNITDFDKGSCEGLCGLETTLEYDSTKLTMVSIEALNGFELTQGESLVLTNNNIVTNGTAVLRVVFENLTLTDGENTEVSFRNITASDGDNRHTAPDAIKVVKWVAPSEVPAEPFGVPGATPYDPSTVTLTITGVDQHAYNGHRNVFTPLQKSAGVYQMTSFSDSRVNYTLAGLSNGGENVTVRISYGSDDNWSYDNNIFENGNHSTQLGVIEGPFPATLTVNLTRDDENGDVIEVLDSQQFILDYPDFSNLMSMSPNLELLEVSQGGVVITKNPQGKYVLNNIQDIKIKMKGDNFSNDFKYLTGFPLECSANQSDVFSKALTKAEIEQVQEYTINARILYERAQEDFLWGNEDPSLRLQAFLVNTISSGSLKQITLATVEQIDIEWDTNTTFPSFDISFAYQDGLGELSAGSEDPMHFPTYNLSRDKFNNNNALKINVIGSGYAAQDYDVKLAIYNSLNEELVFSKTYAVNGSSLNGEYSINFDEYIPNDNGYYRLEVKIDETTTAAYFTYGIVKINSDIFYSNGMAVIPRWGGWGPHFSGEGYDAFTSLFAAGKPLSIYFIGEMFAEEENYSYKIITYARNSSNETVVKTGNATGAELRTKGYLHVMNYNDNYDFVCFEVKDSNGELASRRVVEIVRIAPTGESISGLNVFINNVPAAVQSYTTGKYGKGKFFSTNGMTSLKLNILGANYEVATEYGYKVVPIDEYGQAIPGSYAYTGSITGEQLNAGTVEVLINGTNLSSYGDEFTLGVFIGYLYEEVIEDDEGNVIGTEFIWGYNIETSLSFQKEEKVIPVLSITRASDTSLKLTWTKDTGATGYEIYRSTTEGGTYSKVATITKNSTVTYTNKSLKNATAYYYKVRSYKTVSGSKVYSDFSAVVGGAALKTPSIKAARKDYNLIGISWAKISGADGYAVYRSTSEKGTYELLGTVSGNASIGYDDTTAITNTTYYYRVRGYKTIQGVPFYSANSAVKSAKATMSTPSLTATATSTEVNLSWGAITGSMEYEVYRSTSAKGTYSRIGTTSGLVYTDNDATSGKTFYYKVRAARDIAGTTVFSSYSAAKVAVSLSEISITKIARSSNTSLKLTWEKVVGASGYVVYRSTKADSGFKAVKTITKGSTVSFTNTKLKSGTSYYYKVRSYKTVAGKKIYGPYSDVKAGAALKTPSITVKSANYKEIAITWKKITGASGYEVLRSETKGGTYVPVATVTGNASVKYVDTVTHNKTYYYKVRAFKTHSGVNINGANSGVKSAKAVLKTPGITVKSGVTGVDITWDTIAGATEFEIYRATSSKGKYAMIGTSSSAEYVDTTVVTGKTYYYKVRAKHTDAGINTFSAYSAAKKIVYVAKP